MFEDEQMHLGNANAEGECLTVEAMKTSGLRVSMMRATCNLPSRPSKIIAYPYKGCNWSGGQNRGAILEPQNAQRTQRLLTDDLQWSSCLIYQAKPPHELGDYT